MPWHAHLRAQEGRTEQHPGPTPTEWPYVGVVIATRNRPHLVRRALASVEAQNYPGPMRVVVVYDDVAPDWRLAGGGERPVLVLENWRTAGLAGARNTGILAAGDCELVAFCDDADTWSPAKLTAQVRAMRSRPGTLFVTCAAEIEYGGRRTPRLVGPPRHGLAQLARGRGGLPASGFLARQDALATDPTRGGIGLVTEDGPAGGAEWDLLLRAARRAPIVNVDQPLVRVLWRRTEIDPAACANGPGRCAGWPGATRSWAGSPHTRPTSTPRSHAGRRPPAGPGPPASGPWPRCASAGTPRAPASEPPRRAGCCAAGRCAASSAASSPEPAPLQKKGGGGGGGGGFGPVWRGQRLDRREGMREGTGRDMRVAGPHLCDPATPGRDGRQLARYRTPPEASWDCCRGAPAFVALEPRSQQDQRASGPP